MRKAPYLSVALLATTLALAACERRQEMVAADELPAGALDAVTSTTRTGGAAFTMPDGPQKAVAPPTSL